MATYKRGSGNYKSSFINVITKEADQQVTSSETMVDDNKLFFKLGNTRRYSGILFLRLDAEAAPDMDFTFKAITGTSYAEFEIGTATTAQTPAAFGVEHTLTTSGAIQTLYITFQLRTGSAGGTLQFQFAQGTSDAATTKVKQGSMLMVIEE